ncbi:hypothetical protein SCLARK_001058 [Spiroplasma clarkii]|uniref:Uncharacterized protein n=1 Tax=Spiroplasma clarkii TaxID=2139 RepID=A0A1Y0L1M4_9MOLU|nr:hypothetical protein [Spiroplasma clarkii]ARU91638.1 hypothetical protein SCLARK_001058 [Spiroplasma clarkii]ATX71032.1 hypothetical protein SCLAR_v1c07150 [Spiroplasma clarkii]
MLGKYNFTAEHLPKVLKYFEITTSYAFIWLDLVNEAFASNQIEFNKLQKIKEKLFNLEYLDTFQEVRDEFYFAYEDASFLLVKLINEGQAVNAYDLTSKLYSLKETFLITDNLIRFCYDFISQNQKVPDYDQVVGFIFKKLKIYLKQILDNKIVLNEVFDTKIIKSFSTNLANEDLDTWSRTLETSIEKFEANYMENHDLFLQTNDMTLNYWKIMGLLTQMQTLCEIINLFRQ